MSIKKIKKEVDIDIRYINAPKYEEPVSFIIPCAGSGKRMKSYGVKSLISLGSETIIDRQIRLIKSFFLNPQIIVICGFEGNRLMNALDQDICLIENTDYENTNVVKSIAIGLRAAIHYNTFIIKGDLVFNEDIFNDLKFNNSFTFTSNKMNDREVGCNFNSTLEYIMYDLENKWSQMLYLNKKDTKIIQKLCFNSDNHHKFLFEIVNLMVDMGSKIKIHSEQRVTDIDKYTDLEIIKEII
jgi:choline kinase